MVNENFCIDKKNRGLFCAFLVQSLAIFDQKISFLDIFLETAHQIYRKIGQKLVTVAFNHLLAVFCLGKFLFQPVYPFLSEKYIACGDAMWFLAVCYFLANCLCCV